MAHVPVLCSGLVDARNTALLAQRMMTDGCLLTLTRSLRRVSSDSTPCATRSQSGAEPAFSVCVSQAPLKPRAVCVSQAPLKPRAVCVSQAPLKPRAVCVSVSSERPAAQQQTSVCRSLVSPRTVLSSTHTPSRPPGTLGTLAALLRHHLRPREHRRLLERRSAPRRGGGARVQ